MLKSSCLVFTLLTSAALIPRPALAEFVLQEDAFASSGGQSFKNVVRAADGRLYCVAIVQTEEEERQLVAHISDDGGESWDLDPFRFNDDATGLSAPNATNGCAVAIDDRGVLHVTWGSYYYPSNYRQFYRQWDPSTGASSAILDLSAWAGAAATARTAAMDLAIDEEGVVWIVTHGPQSWIERLARSVVPYAEDLEFRDVGTISPSASAQTSRLAIDVAGRVHCTFYRNIGNGQYEHRYFDSESETWSGSVNLGNTAAPNDFWGVTAADALGNLHLVLVEDSGPSSPLWAFRYRRWSEPSGWSEPVDVFSAEPAEYVDISSYRIIALGADESSGHVSLLCRDLTRDGALGLYEKALDDETFGTFREIAPATTALHAYHSPAIRGRLFPASDRTEHGLHLTWQHRPDPEGPPYRLIFSAPDGSSTPVRAFRRGDSDQNGTFNLTDAVYGLSALFLAGSPQPVCLDAADSNDDGQFNLSDGVFTLNALFGGGTPPPAPGFERCGPDPSDDALDCARTSGC